MIYAQIPRTSNFHETKQEEQKKMDTTAQNIDSGIDGGVKRTEGKVRMDLIPPEVMLSYGEVLTSGAKLYSDRNWEKGLKFELHHMGAALRHINKWRMGENDNIETLSDGTQSSHNHLEHALFHIAAIITQIKRGRTDLDDRVHKKTGGL